MIRSHLISQHIVPDTDGSFVIESFDSQFIYLRNIMTGSKNLLIQGSASNNRLLPAVFFKKHDENGYELHFCTQ